ncbi:glycoside hydrolase family 3 protein [Streptococcus sp. DD13]|uniref:glycoside hydrolase family 3 protein n=1 Tax=Streptococcus sp. DD13 TaxID=1777881 RepID=UPI0007938393|nr:glycoside hydrolase family 3 protein [Streptococcus sp. DD13]KXT79028.1 Beta-glucosidase [Streptococcus sp. DD13]
MINRNQQRSLLAVIVSMSFIGSPVSAADTYPSSYQSWDAETVVRYTLVLATIAVVAAIVFGIYRIVKIKSLKSLKRRISFGLSALLGILVIAANVAVSAYTNVIDAYFAPSYADQAAIKETSAVSRKLVSSIQEEGSVLLENKNKALPLKDETKVNVFGISSVKLTYGGSGSGAADESQNVDLQTSLKDAGFEVNDELTDFYKKHLPEKKKENVFSLNGGDYNIYEPAQSEYSEDLMANAKKFSNTAIFVVSRNGGEGADLPQDMKDYKQGDAGKHYLELQTVEKELLQKVEENFDKVIVLVNSSNAMELGFLKDSKVDAALWIGGPGVTGMSAVGKILKGEVNPSGRLVDTYAYDLESNPTFFNTGDFTYTNTGYSIKGMDGKEKEAFHHFVHYQEGIYLGYRYYETRFVDNQTGQVDESNYNQTVQYPFGYGLSYTSFKQEMTGLTEADGKITVQAKLTNTGDVAGKEVAQVYFTAPYTQGGIEKSHVVLAGFAKTKDLAPGESQTLNIEFNRDDLASYDYKNAKAYVLDKGDYQIKLMNNAHQVLDSKTYTVAQTEIRNQRSTDKQAVTNQFDDAAGDVSYASRADWAGTLPTKRTENKKATETQIKELDVKNDRVSDSGAKASEATGQKGDLRLLDLKDADYDDPRWDKLLDQMSTAEMAKLIGYGGYTTGAVASVDKPATLDIDGPAGVNGIFQNIHGVQYNSEVVVASTWNTELAKEMGDAFAKEAKAHGVVGLYGPAVNIHRSPFSGRNFEYYSEDPTISGKMASALSQAALKNGVYTYTKHFALNDQEDNRIGVATWANEQAIREIYLKAFEIPVKDGGSTAIMSAFNRLGTLWAGGNKALLQTVLRDEWGFKGMVITDYFMPGSYMSSDQAIRAGGDLMLSTLGALPSEKSTGTEEGQAALRKASKNILYTVAHSAAFDLYSPKTKWWLVILIVVNLLLVALTAFGLIKSTARKAEKTVQKEKSSKLG